jgi:HK97 gp10 family phage protein
MALKVSITGVEAAKHAVDQLPTRLRRRAIKFALRDAGKVMLRATKAHVPRETGLLNRSLGIKTAVPTNPKKPAWVKVGARRGFKLPVERNKRGRLRALTKKLAAALPESTQTRFRNPTRYLHLVERGTKNGVKGQRFLERAAVTSRAQVTSAINDKLRAAVRAYRA